MKGTTEINDTLAKNKQRFDTELKMYINQRLFDKKIISEDMYSAAKDVLIRQAI